VLAAIVAVASAYSSRLLPLRRGRRAGAAVVGALRAVHTGHVGDYVAWLLVGVAGIAALVGVPLAG
jgi:multicomponent Na+:H+ antiporter subunit D